MAQHVGRHAAKSGGKHAAVKGSKDAGKDSDKGGKDSDKGSKGDYLEHWGEIKGDDIGDDWLRFLD